MDTGGVAFVMCILIRKYIEIVPQALPLFEKAASLGHRRAAERCSIFSK